MYAIIVFLIKRNIFNISLDSKVLKLPDQFLENSFNSVIGIDLNQHVSSPIVIDYLHRLLVVSVKSLQNCLLVVIRSTTGLASFQQPFAQNLLRASHVDDERVGNFVIHLDVPVLEVLLVSRKSVYQESALFPSVFVHRLLQQFYCDLTRDNFSFDNTFFD